MTVADDFAKVTGDSAKVTGNLVTVADDFAKVTGNLVTVADDFAKVTGNLVPRFHEKEGFERQRPVGITYKGVVIDCGYRGARVPRYRTVH